MEPPPASRPTLISSTSSDLVPVDHELESLCLRLQDHCDLLSVILACLIGVILAVLLRS